MSDWRRYARESLRRLVEPACGPGQQLHEAIASMADDELLHLVSDPDLRHAWTTLWSPDGSSASDLYRAILASGHPGRKPLTNSQTVSLAAWFDSGRPVSVLTAGARAVGEGADQAAADFLVALRDRGTPEQV